jgi:hypothetical protein
LLLLSAFPFSVPVCCPAPAAASNRAGIAATATASIRTPVVKVFLIELTSPRKVQSWTGIQALATSREPLWAPSLTN